MIYCIINLETIIWDLLQKDDDYGSAATNLPSRKAERLIMLTDHLSKRFI